MILLAQLKLVYSLLSLVKCVTALNSGVKLI